jgi:hypothetical protein
MGGLLVQGLLSARMIYRYHYGKGHGHSSGYVRAGFSSACTASTCQGMQNVGGDTIAQL